VLGSATMVLVHELAGFLILLILNAIRAARTQDAARPHVHTGRRSVNASPRHRSRAGTGRYLLPATGCTREGHTGARRAMRLQFAGQRGNRPGSSRDRSRAAAMTVGTLAQGGITAVAVLSVFVAGASRYVSSRLTPSRR
jgi:hypothetical protein